MLKHKLLSLLLISCALAVFATAAYQPRQGREQTLSAFEQTEKVTIANDYYGYSFQIPANWYQEMGVTHDRWTFLSDPTAAYRENSESLHPSPPPNGLIYVQFSVDPVPNWLPAPKTRNPSVDEWGNATSETLIPLLPPGTWTVVNNTPALLVQENIESPDEVGEGHFVKATSVYIVTERMVYYLWIAFVPPTSGDELVAESNYEKAVTDILGSFIIDQKAPAVWQPLK